MHLNYREREMVHSGLDEMLRMVISGGIEIVAVHRLKVIVNLHVRDDLGQCVACDLAHPCRTLRAAYGEWS